jgi:hypothetical protein
MTPTDVRYNYFLSLALMYALSSYQKQRTVRGAIGLVNCNLSVRKVEEIMSLFSVISLVPHAGAHLETSR